MKINSLITKCSSIMAVVVILISSCKENILDTKPLGLATEGDITAGGFDASAFGLYGKIRETAVTNWTRYWFQSIRSDDAAKGSAPTDQAAAGNTFDRFAYNAAEGLSKEYWDGHYSLIYACNDLIDAIDKSGKNDNATLINKAEARVIRAFAYFDLRRDYGQVPLIDIKIVKPTDAQKAKAASIAEVDAFIKADLDFAIQYLPLTWSNYPGRATKGVANTLLAKLYLYQNNWSSALAKCQEVINSGVYTLHSSYKTLFSEAGDNSSEGIFEVQFLRTAQGKNYSNNYWESQGVRGTTVWDLGWGFNVPTPELIAAYEANDPRKDVTILTSGQTDGFGLTLPDSPPLDQKYWNKKAYTTPSIRQGYGENKNHWINIKILRYADVILMAAEAANESANSTLALNYLEMIRARARAGAAVLPAVTTTDKAQLRTAIKQERRIEFALEGERFYDLVRWGDAPTVLGALGYLPKHALFPIPQTAIDQSGGLLVQNPNY